MVRHWGDCERAGRTRRATRTPLLPLTVSVLRGRVTLPPRHVPPLGTALIGAEAALEGAPSLDIRIKKLLIGGHEVEVPTAR